ncbi:cytochrome P450 [Sparassis latifolia]
MDAANSTMTFTSYLIPAVNAYASAPISWSIYALAAALVAVSWKLRRSFAQSPSSVPIVNGRGEALPHADEDTRFSRFSHGKEIGDQLLKELGPIYTFQAGKIRELVLTSPEDIKVYYKDALGRDEDKAHKKALGASFGDYMTRFLSKAVGFQYGYSWKRIRNSLDPHFVRKMALDAIPYMKSDFVEWIVALRSSPQATAMGANPSDPFEIQAIAATKELPFKVISKSTYGETLTPDWYARLWALHPIHDECMANAIGNSYATHWWYRFMPTAANQSLRAFKDGYKSFNREIVAESEKRGHDTVAARMYTSVVDGLISEDEFHQTLDEILFANIDVTSVAQAWLLVDLGLYPEIQEEVRAEVLAVDESNPKALETYLSSTTNLLHLVHSESARLHPVLWYNIPEVISVDKTISGYRVPRGTSVCVSTYHLNTNPSVWGTDAQTFRPSRFTEMLPNKYRHAFWRYGLGPRQCLGKNFALLIVKLVAMKALRKYRIETIGEIGFDKAQFTVTPQALLRFTPL